MQPVSLTIAAGDVQARIRQRLIGLNPAARRVVWRSATHAVYIHVDRTQARLLRGWLVVALTLETDQTQIQTLELVYFLGAAQDGDGTGAAVRINAATREAAMLAEVWGDDLQRVVWDAVLDAIQAALQRARREHPNDPLTLRGFLATPEGLQVDVVAGAL
jgi:hypothetical protein